MKCEIFISELQAQTILFYNLRSRHRLNDMLRTLWSRYAGWCYIKLTILMFGTNRSIYPLTATVLICVHNVNVWFHYCCISWSFCVHGVLILFHIMAYFMWCTALCSQSWDHMTGITYMFHGPLWHHNRCLLWSQNGSSDVAIALVPLTMTS